MTIASWITRLIVAAIFVMGVIPKFTGGAAELAERLPGGSMVVYAIGAIEALAVVLLLVPGTALAGSALAAVVMLGAIGSHVVGPVGMEGDFAGMFIMALIAFVAATASTIILVRTRRLPANGPVPAA
jgi:uncharacterized membrane protein YphA (DoxX/SURF4 family)